jgi:hypothetical protein
MTDIICAARMPCQTNYVVCGKRLKVAAQTMSAWTRREQAESAPQTKTVIARPGCGGGWADRQTGVWDV